MPRQLSDQEQADRMMGRNDYAVFAPPTSLRGYVRGIKHHSTMGSAGDSVELDLDLQSAAVASALRDSLGALSETLNAQFSLEWHERNSIITLQVMILPAAGVDIYATVARFYDHLNVIMRLGLPKQGGTFDTLVVLDTSNVVARRLPLEFPHTIRNMIRRMK